MSVEFRRQIPLAITFVISIFLILDYFLKMPASIAAVGGTLQNWGVIVIAFSLGLGAIVTLNTHLRRIQRRAEGQWAFSIVLFAAFFLFLGVGLSLGTLHPSWDWLYQSIMLPLYATTYSMWCFYMASGAYRAFRARNRESTVLLISGIIVMLGNVPIGEVIWGGFPLLRNWIMSVPNMAVNRGIVMGAALGAIILGLRVLIGKETGYLGRRD
jgi:hypothetical protein